MLVEGNNKIQVHLLRKSKNFTRDKQRNSKQKS